MNNLKFSLKSHQFSKKRQSIFPKQISKQSISLEVHDPDHNLSNLLQFNKTSEQSGMIAQMKRSSEDSLTLSEKMTHEGRPLKYILQPFGDQTEDKKAKTKKQKNHSIASTSKLNIPEQYRTLNKFEQKTLQSNNFTKSTTNIRYDYSMNLSQQEYMKIEMQKLKYVFLNNQQRLERCVDSINILYANTIELYKNHEIKLKQLVSNRCSKIISLFKIAIKELKLNEKNIDNVENKVSLLLNTVNNTKQSLRITKIKQQCIEALQKQHQSKVDRILPLKQKVQHGYIKFPWNENQAQNQQNQDQFNFSQSMVFSQIQPFQTQQNKITNNKPKQSQKEKQKTKSEQINSFLSDYKSNSSSLTKKSPLQASDLFLISSTVPIHHKINSKDGQYSFQNNLLLGQKDPHGYKSLKETLIKVCLSQQEFRKIVQEQVWVDNLECLRRRNGTYLLDPQGNAIICSSQNFQRLKNQICLGNK